MLIQLYVFRQLLISVAFSVTGIALIVLPTIAIQAINKLGAISAGVVLQYLPMVMAELVPYLLPMAFLLGVVATYGRLAAERELIAIRMAGYHPARLAWPAVALALPLVLGTDYLVGEASPEWKYQQREYLRKAEWQRIIKGMRGQNVLQFGKCTLISEENFENVRRHVVLSMEQDDQQVRVEADEAVVDVVEDALRIQLHNARVFSERAQFANVSPTLILSFADLLPSTPRSRNQSKYMTNGQMRSELDSGVPDQKLRHEFQYQIHRRHALSMTYLLFLLLGIPTGIVLRSGTQLGAFSGAVGYAFLYYVLALRLGKVLAAVGAIPPLVAAWATNTLFALVGLVFFVRALWR